MNRRAPRQSERSDFYAMILEPPRATPAILSAATARGAETAHERDARLARKTTTPAPRARRRGPRGRRDELEIEPSENDA